MISFYDFAGGAEYVELSNNQFRGMQADDAAKMNSAVLIGLTDVPAVSVQVNGQETEPTRSRTLVRLFLPVDRQPEGVRARTEEELKSE